MEMRAMTKLSCLKVHLQRTERATPTRTTRTIYHYRQGPLRLNLSLRYRCPIRYPCQYLSIRCPPTVHQRKHNQCTGVIITKPRPILDQVQVQVQARASDHLVLVSYPLGPLLPATLAHQPLPLRPYQDLMVYLPVQEHQPHQYQVQ
jgi:hypothetical protein